MANNANNHSKGLLQGVGAFTMGKVPDIASYFDKLKEDPDYVKEGWERLVCLDPDHLDVDEAEYDPTMLQAMILKKATGGSDDEGEEDDEDDPFKKAVKKAPLQKLLKAAAKDTWEEICKTGATVDGFLLQKMQCDNEKVNLLTKFLYALWRVIEAVECSKPSRQVTTANRIEERNKAAKTLCACIKHYVKDVNKKGSFWQQEAYKHLVTPCLSTRDRSRSPRKGNIRVARSQSPQKGSGGKISNATKNEWRNKFKKAGEEHRDQHYPRPYDSSWADEVIQKAMDKSATDESAAKIVLSSTCKNCLLTGQAPGHKTRKCPHGNLTKAQREKNKKDDKNKQEWPKWRLACQDCLNSGKDANHPYWECPK